MSIAEVRYRAVAFERESLAMGTAGSGVTLSAAVVVALLLAAVAWSPFFSGTTPEVDMPPVVAVTPPAASAPAFLPLLPLVPAEPSQPDLWESVRWLFPEQQSEVARDSRANPDRD